MFDRNQDPQKENIVKFLLNFELFVVAGFAAH